MALCNALENNEYLSLPKLCVEPHQHFLPPVANALSKNSSLISLVLVFAHKNLENPLLSEDTKAVVDMLKVNKTLRFLYLIVNISDWSPIIEGLNLNTTITIKCKGKCY